MSSIPDVSKVNYNGVLYNVKDAVTRGKMDEVDAARQQAIQDIQAEGQTQTGAVTAEGIRVLDTIPSDYTALAGDVDALYSHDEYVNYNYDTPANIAPDSSAPKTRRLGVKRDKQYLILNGDSNMTNTDLGIKVRLNGSVSRVYLPDQAEEWTNGITLTEGHVYIAELRFLGGTASARPGISIYKTGASSTVATKVTGTDDYYSCKFTAEANAAYNVVLYVPYGSTYTDAEYTLTLRDATALADRSDFVSLRTETTLSDADKAIARENIGAASAAEIAAISANLESLSGSPLPVGYQQIEYIESSGTQSILARNGSHPLNQDSRVVITFAQTEDGVSATNYLFGARHNTSSRAFYITITGGGSVRSAFGASGDKITGALINDTKIHTIDKNKNLVYLDGTLVYTHGAWSGDPAPYNSRVGAIKTATNMSCGRNRIYRYTEYDDGVLAADLIPCKRLSDNVIGMYDLVNESFRTNEGTGVYTAGAAPSLENTNQKVSEIESDLNSVIADVADIKDSVYGQTYVQEEADRVAAKVRGVQTGKTLTFVAVSDLHYSVYNLSSDTETPALVQAALKDMRDGINGIAGQTHIDFYACFGDVIYQWQSHGANYENGVQEMIGVTKLLNSAFGNNPQVRMVGNHDPNCENTDGKEFSAYQLNAYLGIYSDMLEKVSPYGGYGYHDFDRQKIRLIVLNTSYYGKDEDLTNGATRYSFGFIQAYRLCGMLDLSEKEDAQDWQIIICSHVALDASSQTSICKHTAVLDAYESGGTWTGSTYSYDFSGKNAAKLALYMNGHAHTYWFKNLVYRNASGEAQSVTPMANLYVPNALPGREGFSLLSEADGGIQYTKTAGTAESTAFQVITIDPDAKIVYAHHYGAGIDIIMHYDPQAVTAETTLTTDLASPAWYSKDTDVATVNGGIVTPVASGNTMIWCKSDDDNCCEVWNIGVTVT